MRREALGLIVLFLLAGAGGAAGQDRAVDEALRVKGGHVLGETAEQFFSEGFEKDALSACKAGDYKSLALPSKRKLKGYCRDLADDRDEALSGKRSEYKGGGDTSELREDTYTFDGGRLVKMELVFTAPSAEMNYRGQSFQKLFEATRQSYGPPTSETTAPVQDTYGARYVAHREVWRMPQGAILITEKPGPGGSTMLAAFTRAEYDRVEAAAAKGTNPLQ